MGVKIYQALSSNSATNYVSTSDGTSVSGTASATITMSQRVDAGSFVEGNIIRVRARFKKNTLNGNSNFIISVNTTNSLVGALTLGLVTANTRFVQIKRDLYIKSSATEVFPSAVTSSTDDSTNATAVSSPRPDWSVEQYIIFSITQGATDTALGSGYSIEQITS